MFESEYELDDRSCSKCGHSPTHSRYCTALYCDDGYVDEYEEDAINFSPGEEFSLCDECHGSGIEWWCPSCGADLSLWQKAER
jgi:hypothetical protein